MSTFKGSPLALPLTFETHQLSEGFSSIVYDAHGMAIDTHLSEAQAETIVVAVNAYDKQRALIETLTAALVEAKTRMRNCRGAVESNQVIDKDVRGSLNTGIRDIDEALAAAKKEGF